jgi:hypothetical protein
MIDAVRSQTKTLRSVDPEAPLDVHRIEREHANDIDIIFGRLKNYAENAQLVEVYEKIVATPRVARWIRDTLNQMDLNDGE